MNSNLDEVEKVQITARARDYHGFFAYYKWNKATVDKCPIWLKRQLKAIWEESMNLDLIMDQDERRDMKYLLRSNGKTQKDLDKNTVDPSIRDGAYGAGGKVERFEVPKDT